METESDLWIENDVQHNVVLKSLIDIKRFKLRLRELILLAVYVVNAEF